MKFFNTSKFYNNKVSFICVTILFIFSCNKNENIDDIQNISNEVVEIYLLETLDESRGFCLDIKGYKSNANIENGLQAHTCYSYQGMVAVDQSFDLLRINENEFFMPSFDVCMEAESLNKSSNLRLSSCAKNELQKFIFTNEGRIQLEKNKKLCITISQENSIEGGGGNPVHLIRNIELQNCEMNLSTYQTWGIRS
tara:strand:- start:124 stop:711 length:588 start_codon:yes stop_codon:yes gene_type:complete